MKMIKAVIRPEKCDEVLNKLCESGYRSVTRFGVIGRGKQKGLKVEDVYYDEIPKEMLMVVVEDEDVDKVTNIIVKTSRTNDEAQSSIREKRKRFRQVDNGFGIGILSLK